MRQCVDDYDSDARCRDMLNDFMEHTSMKALVMLGRILQAYRKGVLRHVVLAQKPIHDHMNVSQLDVVMRIMALKSQLGISQDNFDNILKFFGSLLPDGHNLPCNMYESQKLLRVLKMTYEQIHIYPKGCVLFRKDHVDAKYCPKCESSKYCPKCESQGMRQPRSSSGFLPSVAHGESIRRVFCGFCCVPPTHGEPKDFGNASRIART